MVSIVWRGVQYDIAKNADTRGRYAVVAGGQYRVYRSLLDAVASIPGFIAAARAKGVDIKNWL